MKTVSQANFNYVNNTNSLNSKNNTKYTAVHFKGRAQLASDIVQTTSKKSCTSEKIIKLLCALGLFRFATKITGKPFKSDIETIQVNINNKRIDMEKREALGTYFYGETQSADTMNKYKSQMNTLLNLEQKYLNDFKNTIKQGKDKKSLTKDEISSKLAELRVELSKLDTEYNRINDELKLLENARYEELVEKEQSVRTLIDKYKFLCQQRDELDNQKFYDKKMDDELQTVTKRIDSLESELKDLENEYSVIEGKINEWQKQEKNTIESFGLQDTSNSVIAEEKNKLCAQYQNYIDEILNDKRTLFLKSTIDSKTQELKQAKQEKRTILDSLKVASEKYREEVAAKEYPISQKCQKIIADVKNELGFSIFDHPYYEPQTAETVNIPEWITTRNGERPFKTIKDTYKSWYTEKEEDYSYTCVKTIHRYYHYCGGKCLY